MNNFLSTLALSRRAGKLLFGFDSVCDEIKNPKGTVAGVIAAGDISAKTEKEIRFICDKYSVAFIKSDVCMDDIKAVAGKRTGIIAITDAGLYNSILKNINKTQNYRKGIS